MGGEQENEAMTRAAAVVARVKDQRRERSNDGVEARVSGDSGCMAGTGREKQVVYEQESAGDCARTEEGATALVAIALVGSVGIRKRGRLDS